ncbi:hypothetical protein VFPFJ_09805 [Purpureocillium lilacinum]|uniref:Uncharacterized protein n=1 Tax=Purpureocillium lilacinum TaxID=33203 RepID=A0A179GQA0_PURLI|nr:hypothetical protein VFPFJ_09805 [Purpureocillium lilacinum]OAQ79319.1 hypothetical protein VFPFJ_09805 [Purpureocillium lilacinum]
MACIELGRGEVDGDGGRQSRVLCWRLELWNKREKELPSEATRRRKLARRGKRALRRVLLPSFLPSL